MFLTTGPRLSTMLSSESSCDSRMCLLFSRSASFGMEWLISVITSNTPSSVNHTPESITYKQSETRVLASEMSAAVSLVEPLYSHQRITPEKDMSDECL